LEYIIPNRPSPDGSGILFLLSLSRKRYSGQREIASKKKPIKKMKGFYK
jgi:hypothetical protein